MVRRSTGKRLRFEVFKRDYFTCQYCGNQPPTVVLVIDHVVPVAGGGETTLDNLVTACETCNQGKAARPLGAVTPRQDADLLYLSTQQEVGEMRRYQQAIADREQALESLVPALQDVWVRCSGLDWHPTRLVIRQLLNRHSPEVVDEAIRDVALKVGTGYVKSYQDHTWISYLNAVARNLTQEEER